MPIDWLQRLMKTRRLARRSELFSAFKSCMSQLYGLNEPDSNSVKAEELRDFLNRTWPNLNENEREAARTWSAELCSVQNLRNQILGLNDDARSLLLDYFHQ